MMIIRRKSERGFTLIDAMIALVVLATGVLVLGQFQGRMLQSSGDSKRITEASYLAQQKIEHLRSLPWGHDDLAIGVHQEESSVVGSNTEFLVRWVITAGIHDRQRRVAVHVHELLDPLEAPLVTLVTLISEGSSGTGALPLGDGVGELRGPRFTPEQIKALPLSQSGDGMRFVMEDGKVVEIVSEVTGESLFLSNRGFARLSGNILISGDELPFLEFEDYVEEASLRYPFKISATGNALCSTYPYRHSSDFEALTSISDHIAGDTLSVGADVPYRVVRYSCYLSDNWHGQVQLQTQKLDPLDEDEGRPLDLCGGSHDGRPEPNFGVASLTIPGQGATLSRYYTGYAPIDEDNFTEIGVRGSPYEWESEFGAVWMCDETENCASIRKLVPGGHHFLVTELYDETERAGMVSVNEEGETTITISTSESRARCKAAMDHFPEGHIGNHFADNPSSFVCLTPSTCGAATATATRFLTRVAGFMVNNEADVSAVNVSGGICYPFGQFSEEHGTYWCAVLSVANGQIEPSSTGTDFDPDKYYFSITGLDTEGQTKRAGTDPTDFDIQQFTHLTNIDFVMTAAGEETEPTEPGDPVTPPTDPEECITTITGTRHNNGEVRADGYPGSCSSLAGSNYECVIEADEGTWLWFTHVPPGRPGQSGSRSVEANCGDQTLNF